MKQLHLLFFVLISYLINAQGKTLIYDLSIAGSSIGMLTAVKTQNGNSIIYTSDSEAIVHIFGETKITTSLKVEYINGVLQSSYYKIEKNDTLNDESSVILKNGIYTINHSGKVSESQLPINYSVNMLYFEDPKGVTKVFAELEGIFKNIESTGNSTYQLKDPGNHHVNNYTYLNGILKEGVITHALFNFTLRLKEPN